MHGLVPAEPGQLALGIVPGGLPDLVGGGFDGHLSPEGGDEFLVFMSGIPNVELAEARCRLLLSTFSDLLEQNAPGMNVSISIGLAPRRNLSGRALKNIRVLACRSFHGSIRLLELG